jgi:hypothetical protein
LSDFLRRQVGHREILPQRGQPQKGTKGTESTKESFYMPFCARSRFAFVESRQRQLADRSSPFYNHHAPKEDLNPANGSWRIVQVCTVHLAPRAD